MLALPQSDLFIAKYGHDVHSYIVGTKTKKNKKERKKHRAGCQKKDPAFRRRRRAGNKCAQKHFILGGGLFGLLPDSILEGVGDSLCSAVDRYTYTVSVPNMYHIVGRERVDYFALRILAGSMGSPPPATSCEGCSEKKRNKQKIGRKRSGNLILLGEPHLMGLGL